MDVFDDTPAASNQPEYSVSELSGAVKKVIEGEFGLVRVRGEVGRVSRPSSGHIYFALKDDRATLDAVTWKGQAARLTQRPEEGIEVIATGRMTTFPGQSKYQLIVEEMVPAGAGALMAMLEKRRAALAAEGLFDPARKQSLPYLPRVIGVVTSPSGAVIRDILHRLRDRFPIHVLIWPVAVQGKACAPEVAAAIRGFNAIQPGGPVPRPDLLIVARGGGSLEDLWGFNEEIVVRAAAESRIPLISAVGHETDTTLIDHAADLRAPTPTAAAEIAVPVRLELMAALDSLAARMGQGVARGQALRGQRLRDLSRALPRPETLTQTARQRLDGAEGRLAGALGLMVAQKHGQLARAGGGLRPDTLRGLVARKAEALSALDRRQEMAAHRLQERAHLALDKWASRLAPALGRLLTGASADLARGRERLGVLSARLEADPARRLALLGDRLARLDRLRQTLGHRETLARGFAVVRGAEGRLVTSAAMARGEARLEVQFHDASLAVLPEGAAPKPQPKPQAAPRKPPPGTQGSLF